MTALSRRDLLTALLALAATRASPNRGDDPGRPAVLDDILRWLSPDAAPVGERYLQLHSAEADLDMLAQLLLDRIPSAVGDDLPRELSCAVQEDFARGDLVNLDGWLLSRTEVRLCAVIHLAGQIQLPA
jgi:hypothetical protein